MLYFLYRGFQKNTHRRLRYSRGMPANAICSYTRLLEKSRYPQGTYIFMDRERMDPWEIRLFAGLYQHISQGGPGYRALNDPARMMSRYELLRTLHVNGINDFNVYLVSERQVPARYPVFIRHVFDHDYVLTELLHSQAELEMALEKLHAQHEPDEGLMIIEYCAEPVAGTLFRKLSGFRIGDHVFFHHTMHEHSWQVKYGQVNSATTELYQEEYEMISKNAFEREIRQVFELANIEYGRVDFGLVNGKMQVYEINTNPTVIPPRDTHPNPTRNKSMQLSWSRYTSAMQAIDDTDDLHSSPLRGFRDPALLSRSGLRARHASQVWRK
ncbi:MAG: hypothetical protein R3318_06475 [Gammaproteobacteria bacterium]|nr:hypothetical protein [Gammaproteobacteria bacterium]